MDMFMHIKHGKAASQDSVANEADYTFKTRSSNELR